MDKPASWSKNKATKAIANVVHVRDFGKNQWVSMHNDGESSPPIPTSTHTQPDSWSQVSMSAARSSLREIGIPRRRRRRTSQVSRAKPRRRNRRGKRRRWLVEREMGEGRVGERRKEKQ